MAKKEKKFSISSFEKLISRKNETYHVVFDEGIECDVKYRIPLSDVAGFVNGVATVVADSETGEYHPEFRNIITSINILNYYANFNISSDIEKMYELVASTNVVDSIIAHIDVEQLQSINDAITERIQFEIEKIISVQKKRTDELISSVDFLTTQFTELSERLNDMFSGIDPKEFANSAIELSKLNEAEIAKKVYQKQNKAKSSQKKIVVLEKEQSD